MHAAAACFGPGARRRPGFVSRFPIPLPSGSSFATTTISPIPRPAGVLAQPPDGSGSPLNSLIAWNGIGDSAAAASGAEAGLSALAPAGRDESLRPSDPLSRLLDQRAPASDSDRDSGREQAARALAALATAGASPAAAVLAADVDLDAIPAPYHLDRCTCSACSGAGRQPQQDAGATTLPVASSSAPAAAASLQTLATYLTTGYWQQSGSFTRRYNLSSSGTGAKAGTLSFNVSGWSGDSNGLSAERQALARDVLKTYGAMTGITFKEVSGDSGDLRFTDNDTGAYAYAASGWYNDASQTSVTVSQSVINVEAGWYGGQSGFNTYTPQTFFHEIGHALGLGHQGQYNYTGTSLTYDSSAQFANDSWQATMMSYWDQLDNPTTGASFAWLQTPMAVDWLALNDLYSGQGYGSANAFKGDTVYGVGTTISAGQSRIWNEFSTWAGSTAYTLVDGSGYDTLDVSNFSANQLINLAPSQPGATTPSISNIGGKIGNLTIAAGTLIEAASGGAGNDSLLGNEVANTLRGGGGDDSFWDSSGSDAYYGDGGSDWLYFSESLDLFDYAIAGDSLLFSRRSGSADVEQVWNGLENLSFNNVAYTYQQLIDSLSVPPLPDAQISSINGLASGAATNATSLSFSGSLTAPLSSGQTIALYRNGVPVGTIQAADPSGSSWSYTLQEAGGTTSLAYTVRVLETGSGRQGALSAPFQITVDTVAPLVAVNRLDTQDTTPLLSGTINDAAAQVSISLAGISRMAVNHGNGSWSLQWTDPLAAGQTYDVLATASDAAGNSSSDNTSAELNLLADDYSGDSSSTGLVSVGGSSTGVLELAGDRDWFGVDLQVGRTYAFRLDGLSLADPLLTLYGGSGAVLGSNNNLSATSSNALITYTASSSGRHYLGAAAFNDAGAGSYNVSATDVTPQPGAPLLHFSLASSITTSSAAVLGGLTARNNDIIAFDGTLFSVWLNGNANGLSGAVLRDFHIVSNDEVVVAFQAPVTLAGIAFDDSDLARLTRTATGFSLSMLFDGSDVGLTTNNEAIDAITGLADGSWLISTRGSGGVSGVSSFPAEDLLRFRPTSLGATTAGSWSLYADMSDVGISGTSENITAVDVAANGRLALVSQDNVSATGLSAANEDVALFKPSSLGSATSGSFQSPLLFDGSQYGLAAQALQGLDVAF